MKKILLFVAGLTLAGAAIFALQPGPGGPEPEAAEAEVAQLDLEGRHGALVDEIVFTQEADVGKVTGLLERGSHQVFTQGISSTSVFRQLRDSPKTAYDFSYGHSMELTLNPAGPYLADDSLNPFHVPEIREALNKLIDRRYIAEEIYGGLAEPRFLPLNTAFPDYARLADVARELELRYRHDPEAAQEVIHREMAALGASFEDGRWMYGGEPVRLIALIRTEDERKRIGDYVANQLEDIGFRVDRRYRTAEEASRIWIASDPNAGRWHLYTGGWIATMIQRDEAQNFSDYYTPRGRADPLWQAYVPAPEFDEIAERLQRRDYGTWEERQKMMARGLELAMKDSARVWLVDQLNVSARASDVELAVDIAGGMAGSALWPYTLRYTDRVGGRMVFGAPTLLTEPWNPVAGSNWIFDQMIIRSLQDFELIPDPFTGLHWPQRVESADVTVKDGVPVSRTHDWLTVKNEPEIRVPEDAWIDWDTEAGEFVTVGEKHPAGITARTRVRVQYEDDYLERRWHDGSWMSLADVVLPWILTFERADPDSRMHDIAHVPNFEAFQRHFRGWRIVSRDPLVIDIYSDQIYPDAETIVAARAPTVTPWHTLALGIMAEGSGRLAFSSNKADRMRVDWMSLVAGPSLRVLDQQLETARDGNFLPYSRVLQDMTREGEVAERYGALADWREQRGHFWVGDGPFYLHSVHPVEGTVVLRRYEDFPDPADKWLRFTRPEIPELDLEGPMVVEIGDSPEFELRITFEGEPYPRDRISEAQYLLFDGDGALAVKGQADPVGEGVWRIPLTAAQVDALGTGANSLEVAVTTSGVALPSFVSHAFATVPAGAAGHALGDR